MPTFGERLKKLRLESKKTQKELRDTLGISQSTIGAYEKNTRQPDQDKLVKMADYFSVTLDYLLGITDIPFTAGTIRVYTQEHKIIDIHDLPDESQKIIIDLINNIRKINEKPPKK